MKKKNIKKLKRGELVNIKRVKYCSHYLVLGSRAVVVSVGKYNLKVIGKNIYGWEGSNQMVLPREISRIK